LIISCSAGPKSHIAGVDHDDRQLPVQGVVVEQRGIHQITVPVEGQLVPGLVQGTFVVHGGVRHYQRPVPECVHQRAKGVSTHGVIQLYKSGCVRRNVEHNFKNS